MNWIKALNEECEILDNKYNINCGGCCFVAAVIAEELEKYNIEFKAITWDKTYHVAIIVDDEILNPSDLDIDGSSEIVKVSSEDLYYTYQTEEWNDRYSRRWNLIVKSIIHSKFRKYFES